MSDGDPRRRRFERKERGARGEPVGFEAGSRARLERAATHRQDLRDRSWREFWHDLGIRCAAMGAVVVGVALVLWLGSLLIRGM